MELPMRLRLLFLLPLLATSLFAQERGVGRVRPAAPAEWLVSLHQSEERVDFMAAALRRDSFIVAQLVKGIGDLNDFQVNAAIQKALDRVEAARKRASEAPQASPSTMTAISKINDALEHGRQQGATTDVEALKTEMLRQTHFVQQELFSEVALVLRERQALSSALAKLNQMNAQLDGAMVEALGSTFEFVKEGGE
jgi:hypothetical protein